MVVDAHVVADHEVGERVEGFHGVQQIWRASIARAIADRCTSSSPEAIDSSSERSGVSGDRSNGSRPWPGGSAARRGCGLRRAVRVMSEGSPLGRTGAGKPEAASSIAIASHRRGPNAAARRGGEHDRTDAPAHQDDHRDAANIPGKHLTPTYPHGCPNTAVARRFPTGASRDRTGDLLLAKQAP